MTNELTDTLLFRLLTALAIGLLVGIERGWRERDAPAGSRTAGVRTYALAGFLGGVSAAITQALASPWPLCLALLALWPCSPGSRCARSSMKRSTPSPARWPPSWCSRWALTSGISGLFEVDVAALPAVRLASTTAQAAGHAILLALSTNALSRTAIAITSAPAAFSTVHLGVTAAALGAGLAVWLFAS